MNGPLLKKESKCNLSFLICSLYTLMPEAKSFRDLNLQYDILVSPSQNDYFDYKMENFSDLYKLINNLNFESKFTNACTKSNYFKSMVQKANLGDETAKRLVNAYHYRPEIEFFDIQSDPLELNNLASNPAYQTEIARLSLELEKWMSSQGDDGVGTELRAHERQKIKRKKK